MVLKSNGLFHHKELYFLDWSLIVASRWDIYLILQLMLHFSMHFGSYPIRILEKPGIQCSFYTQNIE